MDQQIENWKRQRQQPQRQQQPQQPQQQQPMTAEQIIANSELPSRAKDWLRKHSDYVTDPAKNAKLQKLHNVAEYQSGGEWTDAYFDRMDVLLGFKPEKTNGAGTQPNIRQSAPVSAPISREAPSMTTGRAPTPTKVTLDRHQREVAAQIAQSRNISQAEAEKEYAKQLIVMRKAKADGKLS